MSDNDTSAADRGSGFSAGLGAWQPIETAPRDGRKVILFYLNRNNKARTVPHRKAPNLKLNGAEGVRSSGS